MRLGVNRKGLALVMRAIYDAHSETPVAGVDDSWWQRVAESDADVWLVDAEVFGAHREALLKYLRDVQTESDMVWVEPEDAPWLTEGIIAALTRASDDFAQDEDRQDRYLQLCDRFGCTLFAPFDTAATRAHLLTLLDREEIATFHSQSIRYDFESPIAAFWSWRLTDFYHYNHRSGLFNVPMLTLWRDPPIDNWWAPPHDDVASDAPLSAEEAATYLVDALWLRAETMLGYARRHFRLGYATPKFAGQQVGPPVLYFADPIARPAEAAIYATTGLPAIYPFLQTCLGSGDPFAQNMAWGVLQEDIVVLRREMVRQSELRSWYLLLPFAPHRVSLADVEADAISIATSLTSVEFRTGDFVEDIDYLKSPIDESLSRYGDVVDEIGNLTSEAIVLEPALTSADLEQFRLLHLLACRIQATVGKADGTATGLERVYAGYIDSSEDYLRRNVIYSVLMPQGGILSLRDALLDAYPLHYVKEPLRSLRTRVKDTLDNLQRSSALLETVLVEADRRSRERLEKAANRAQFVLALLAVLVALPAFLPDVAFKLDSFTTDTWQYATIAGLTWATRRLFFIGVLVALVVGMLYIRIRMQRTTNSDEFETRFQKLSSEAKRAKLYAVGALLFRESDSALDLAKKLSQDEDQDIDTFLARLSQTSVLTDGRANEIERALENMDTACCNLLAALWDEIGLGQRHRRSFPGGVADAVRDQLRRQLHTPEATDWIMRARKARVRAELFVLRPRYIPLPRTTCLLLYLSFRYDGFPRPSDEDFSDTLAMAGLHADDGSIQEALWETATKNRGASIGAGEELRELAVALRRGGMSWEPSLRKDLIAPTPNSSDDDNQSGPAAPGPAAGQPIGTPTGA